MQTITLEMNVIPENRDQLLARLVELFPETRKAKGCIYINAYTAKDEPNRVIFLEEWETAEDYQAYLNHRIETGVFEQLKKMLTKEPQITFWNKSLA